MPVFFLSRVVNLHKSNYEIGFKVSSSPGIYPRCNTFHSELYLNKSDFWHWSNYMFQSPHKHHRYTNPSNTITKHISPLGDHQPRLQCMCTQNHKSLHVIQLSSLLYLKQTQCISKKKTCPFSLSLLTFGDNYEKCNTETWEKGYILIEVLVLLQRC